ncbi:unnamed protein product [Penicillium nalgiovense]|uniref:Uncharacterized protein n=1 Tax=Penicillium nalgiovense TaxID=60175 RepID=A0A9W4HWW7_PENNA|nr:unnamed protein product [Penicillium nalgiovense]CAG8080216.1 unnamed protein product [Penicillium nalgiovense]CAG8092341.1 unnamed protein product [Penicillium nalgiovense]CAG8095294.1 unnamed protein product [Penicillium nalgiovense]CAG8101447.1 unnamed protein product [Penicillium nalgiovense]
MSHYVELRPVNATSSTVSQPMNEVASSQRCAVKDCGKWAVAQSRFCADRKCIEDQCHKIINLTPIYD